MAINSIWNNNFYDVAPVPKWSFEMDFTQLFINEDNQKDFGPLLNKSVISCSIPERAIQTIPVYYAGVEGKLPGRVNNSGDLTVKFNENMNFRVTKALEELFHAESSCDAYFKGNGGYSFNKSFNKTDRIIRMIILNPKVIYQLDPENDRNSPLIVHFQNCWLSKIEAEDMSYESDTDTIVRTATFTYDYFRIMGNGESQINDTCKGDE